MFKKQIDSNETGIKAVIDTLISSLESYPADSPEYAARVDQLTKLYDMKKKHSSNGVSADTLATIAANLVGIVAVLHYEKVNVVTSKALAFIPKLF